MRKIKEFWFTHADYVDPSSGEIRRDANIKVEDGVIAKIGGEPAEEERQMDCRGHCLCPGLMDLHTHLVLDGTYECISHMVEEGGFLSAFRGYANSVQTLKNGVTTVRDVGCSCDTMIYLSKAIDSGILEGPTIVPCGRAMQCTGAHASQLGVIADTSDEIMKTIRFLKAAGAQWIKVMATGGACGPEEIGPVLYNKEELALIVRECHRVHLKVCAHALSEEGTANCVEAGIDTIEHGGVISLENLKKMKEKGIALVPTLSIYKELSEDSHWTDNTLKKSLFVAENQRRTFGAAMEIGVEICLGTDAGSEGFGPHPSVYKEMEVMRLYGMGNADIIRSATINPARVLGKDQSLGSIEAGKQADILVLDGNPLKDLSAFTRVREVYKNGNPVINP